MSESQTPNSISQEPVNILFSPSSVVKKDVWEIDLIQILDLLIKILDKTGKKEVKSNFPPQSQQIGLYVSKKYAINCFSLSILL